MGKQLKRTNARLKNRRGKSFDVDGIKMVKHSTSGFDTHRPGSQNRNKK